jgi:hypothetical protein
MDEKLQEIEALLSQATKDSKLPWKHEHHAGMNDWIEDAEGGHVVYEIANEEAGDLLAQAPELLQWCIEEIKRLRSLSG